nr:MAG TPA: hypothetical protein [Caudoviricetes sp.]
MPPSKAVEADALLGYVGGKSSPSAPEAGSHPDDVRVRRTPHRE